jgi:phage tail-like protein
VTKVLELRADAIADGRVALSWRTPGDAAFRGVRVLRSDRRYANAGDAGSAVEVFHDPLTPAGGTATFVDGPLQAEKVYYYTVLAYDAGGTTFPELRSVLATAEYDTDEHLYQRLPEIYQMFDRVQPTEAGAVDRVLHRFLEICGKPFDVLRSYASSMRDLHDIDRVDGGLLPLLAQWIGQPSDITLDLERQRNEIRYAPQYYRTTGVPANLRASINRFVNWDARIKEFVHNVMLVSHPEQLTIAETRRSGGPWSPPSSVSLEIAYEGRVAPQRSADGRVWLAYHARRAAPADTSGAPSVGPGHDRWHLFVKLEDRDEPQPSLTLTSGAAVTRHPSIVSRPDGSAWIFYADYAPQQGRLVPRLRLQAVSIGRPASAAMLTGTVAGPFALVDGDAFDITIGAGPTAVTRHVVVRAERVASLSSVTTAELARLLDRELPGVSVGPTADGRVRLRTTATGVTSLLNVSASTLAARLGIPAGIVTGSDAVTASISGAPGPFALTDGATLSIRVDDDPPVSVTLRQTDFPNIAAATPAQVAAAIEQVLPGVSRAAGGTLQLVSRRSGGQSVVTVLVDASSAAAALGFGAPIPPPPDPAIDEDEPSACVDAAGNVWLFWASRRSGGWDIWYSRFAGTAWGAPKPLTATADPDREPFVLFDPAGRVWVCWTRRKADGRRNVFTRTTTNLNFPVLADGDWTERENAPPPAAFDNCEPSAVMAPTGEVELYYTSNRADGWNVWTRLITAVAQNAESAVTTGQVTSRVAAPLRAADGSTRLFFRTNASQTYPSQVYPATITLDGRYSGSTAVDFRNTTKLSFRALLPDMQRYTYDTRRPDLTQVDQHLHEGLFARDAVGVYLTPDTPDQQFRTRQRQLFTKALRSVLPIQVRVAFILDDAYTDAVYTYASPAMQPPVVIGERMIDTILSEVMPAAQDAFRDRMPEVRFLRTWVPGETKGLPDLAGVPPDLTSRLFTTRFDEGA